MIKDFGTAICIATSFVIGSFIAACLVSLFFGSFVFIMPELSSLILCAFFGIIVSKEK